MRWLVVLVCACSMPTRPAEPGDAEPIDASPDANLLLETYSGPFHDLPPGDDPTVFEGADGPGGPCLIEPQLGTLFPRNWPRPTFSWVPSGSENLFELTLSTPTEASILHVVTSATSWKMPADVWAGLATHVLDQAIAVEIRGGVWDGTQLVGGPQLGDSGSIAIAPAAAAGAIVYWTPNDGTAIRGFRIGDDTVTDLVTPATTGAQCVGCHVVTPDGAYLGFEESNGPSPIAMQSADGLHASPTFMTTIGENLLARDGLEWPQFSAQHYTDGDLTLLAEYMVGGAMQIIWSDLQASSLEQGTGWGVVRRDGDTRSAACPAVAHTSDQIVYASTSLALPYEIVDGELATVPYGGGLVTWLEGASSPDYNQYFPAFSPDDRFVAFDRVPVGQSSYDDPLAELFVVPAGGGVPVRLAANDAAQCGQYPAQSPGSTNSWPKWSPVAPDIAGKRYYWIAFSSTRRGNPQLFVAPVVDDGTGTLRTYPALYLWNQDPEEHNHTPSWEVSTVIP